MASKNGDIINVGLIGLGTVAQVIHLPVLQSLPERYRIAALCDVSPGLVGHIGRQYGVAEAGLYTDAHRLVRQDDLDAVFVLNSDEYHAECAIAAADRGKHVLIEKPMCLTVREADAIIAARDRNHVKMMVGYMRRFAAAFVEAAKEVGELGEIAYARVRDIIGPNSYFIDSTHHVVAFDDVPEALQADRRARAEQLCREATGLDGGVPHGWVYRFLTGLGSHDLSAMRELLGMPLGVVGAKAVRNGGSVFLSAILDYGRFAVTYETGIDRQGRFDAHIEVYSAAKSVKVQYDTPYIRHLPTKLIIQQTDGDSFRETVVRPTFTDPYTLELNYFYDMVTSDATPKTTPEDYKNDLVLFAMILDALEKR